MTSVIELEGVELTYPGPPPVPALLPVTKTVHRGDYIAIVGPSGSGKSTLLNVLGLLDRPTSGRYVLDGHDTGSLNETDRTALRARRIGFVFQAFHLLDHRTANENVAMGMLYTGVTTKERLARAREALDRVGLSHRREALPRTLSGGEKQRVAIARAIVGRPDILLCDEPTGNLDSVSTTIVLDLIDELRRDGLTVFIITHDASVAAHGRRTLHIADGRVTET